MCTHHGRWYHYCCSHCWRTWHNSPASSSKGLWPHNVINKVQLRANSVKYLGTIIGDEVIKPDPVKASAMVNFLASHIPNLATMKASLCALLKTDTRFLWAHEHNNALEKLKCLLSGLTILTNRYCDPSAYSVFQADTSQHGLGACLLQKGLPTVYASRCLTMTPSAIMYRSKKKCWPLCLLAIIPSLHVWFSHWCTVSL